MGKMKQIVTGIQKPEDKKDKKEEKTSRCCGLFSQKKEVLDDEEITPEEEQRRYEVAMNGWAKKCRKDDLMGNVVTKFEKKSIFSYQRWVIQPNSKWKFWWKFYVTVLLLYSLFLIPFMLAFQHYPLNLKIVDMVIDFFLIIELLLHFFYAFVNKRQKVQTNFCPIFTKYMFGMFIFDLAALFPYYLSDAAMQWHWLKLFRLFRLSYVGLFISKALNEILLKMTSNINFTLSLTRIIMFGFLLLLAAQMIGSVWYYIGWENLKQEKGWIYVRLLNNGAIEYDQTTTYISSIYWVFTTLSTLGYGDLHPVEKNEYLFTMLIEFMGVFLFAYMMGNINNLIEKLDDDVDEYLENKLEKLDQWLMKIDRANSHRKLKHEMVLKIKDALHTYWTLDHVVVQKDGFLDQLPVGMRKNLISHLFSSFFSKFYIFYNGLEEGFQQQIVINLFPRKFRKGEDVISINSGSKHIYFLAKGKVCIGNKDAIEKYVLLEEGAYFGDYLIFFRLKSSNAFIAMEDTELMCIHRNKFLQICEMYPKSAKLLKYKAYLRRKFVRSQKILSQKMTSYSKKKEKKEEEKKNDGEGDGNLLHTLSKGHKPIKKFMTYKEDELWSDSDEIMNKIDLLKDGDYNPENESRKKKLIEKSKKLSVRAPHVTPKGKLDILAEKINSIEGDFHKKLKTLRSHVDFLSHFEDYFRNKRVEN